MKNSKISIITICYNEVYTIKRTIESVFNQSFKDYEYIVIDGASTDGTVDIIRSYEKNIDYLVSEKDTGIYEAMNKGIRQAHGEYLYFLNGGDLLAGSDVLEKAFSTKGNEDILYGDILKAVGKKQYLNSFSGYSVTPFFLFTHTLPHQGSFIKKVLFDKFGLYDESYRLMGDYEFFKRAIVVHGATCRYLGFTIGVFDYTGMSTKAEYKPLQRSEIERARLSSYGALKYIFFHVIWGFYDFFIFHPRRRIRKLSGKS